MEVNTSYATYDNCYLKVDKYQANKSLAIEIWNDEDGPIARLTVCLPNERKPKENEAYIDDNNCPWAMDFIEEYNLGTDTFMIGLSGFCMYPKVAFNMDEVEKYTR